MKQSPIHRWTYINPKGETFTLEFTDPVFMDDILAKFEIYLRGLTYVPKGKLEWVPTSEESEGYGESEEEPKFI